MLTLVVLLLVLVVILLAIIRYEIHPFLALFGGAIGYGLLVGMDFPLILKSITEGFGGVMGNIGLLILFGVILGTFLEKTGGALVIAEKVLSWLGEKSITLSLMLSGWALSIPVFVDSTLLMMNPIAKTLASKSTVSYAATIVAVSLGAMVSHSLIPPTPGPIATAGIVGADLGQVILYGSIVSLIALVPVHFFLQKWVTQISVHPQQSPPTPYNQPAERPKLVTSLLPILTPLALIFLASIASYPTNPLGKGTFAEGVIFLGNPIIALSIGVLFSFALPKKFDRTLLSATGWIGEALLAAAPVIFITGAGAVFGKMLQNSGIGMVVTNALQGANWGLFLPFLLAFGLKCAQGSTTVAMITTASIVAPLLSPLGLDSAMLKVFTTLAIGSGAIAISHANDSAFWVVTQLSGMSTKQGNLSHSLGTLLTSISAMAAVYLLSLLVT